MNQQDTERYLQNRADIADYLSNLVEDLFSDDPLLQTKMIYHETVLDQRLHEIEKARYEAVQAIRNLRRRLEENKVAIAFESTR